MTDTELVPALATKSVLRFWDTATATGSGTGMLSSSSDVLELRTWITSFNESAT